MSILRYMACNSLVRLAAFTLGVVVSFCITPYILRSLGAEHYGAWALASSLAGYYMLLDFGVLQGVTRFLAASEARRDVHEGTRIVTTALCFSAVSCLCVLLAGGIFSLFVEDLTGNVIGRRTLLTVLGMFTVSMAFVLLTRSMHAMLMARMQWTLLAVLGTIRSVSVALALLFVFEGGASEANFFRIGAVASAGQALEALAICFLALWRSPVRVRLSAFSPAQAKILFRYGLPVLVSQIGNILRGGTQIFLVTSFLDLTATTVYALASRFIGYMTDVMLSTFGIFSPYFSGLTARGDFAAAHESLQLSLRLSYTLSSAIALCFAFYCKPFITLWIGPEFVSIHDVLLPMALGSMLALGQYPATGYLLGVGRHGALAAYTVGEGVFNTAASVPALLLFGLPGVGWATFCGATFTNLFLLPRRIAAAADISLRALYANMATILFPQLAAQTAYYLLVSRWVKPDYRILFAASCGQFLVAALICWISTHAWQRSRSRQRKIRQGAITI